MKLSKHFDSDEFDSPDQPGSGKQMNELFIETLENARSLTSLPFIISSGFRTKNHNKKVSGVKNSSHLKGIACDIFCTTARDRFILINALIEGGFQRIGIAETFIHVDIDYSKPYPSIFLY